MIAVGSSPESGASNPGYLAGLQHLVGRASGEADELENGFLTLDSADPSVDRHAGSLGPPLVRVDEPVQSPTAAPDSLDNPVQSPRAARNSAARELEIGGAELPKRPRISPRHQRAPENITGLPVRADVPGGPGQRREHDAVNDGADRGPSLSEIVEHPSEQVITGGRDVYVAHRDINNLTILVRSLTPSRTDIPVLDEHESLYKLRPFGPGSGSSSGSGFSSSGVVSPGGGSVESPRDLARTRPALMLGGHAAVTEFVGRAAGLSDLTTWYERPGRVSAMLVHGTVGQGKTRLTREFARKMTLRDEKVIVRETIPLTEVSLGMLTSEDEPPTHRSDPKPTDLLLLVDEADLWPAQKLRKMLRDIAATSYRRVRLLLTGRAAAEWWPALAASRSITDVRWDDLLLEPPGPAEMRELAAPAASSHAARLQWDEPPALPEELWKQLGGCPPLSIELMVLARMHAAEAGWPAPNTQREAAQIALHKELRCWEHMHGTTDPVPGSTDYRIRLDPRGMRRAVYAATLAGPLGQTTARRIVDLAGLSCAPDSQQVIDDHARCYPAADSQYLVPLPAFLAEEFLGLLVPDPKHPSRALLRDQWAVDAPFHILNLLDPQERDDEEATRDSAARAGLDPSPPTPGYSGHTFGPQHKPVVLRLARAAATWPHLAERQLYPLAERYPRVLVRADGVWSELLNIPAAPSSKVLAALGQAADEVLPQDSPEWLTAKDTLRQLADRKNPPASS